MHVVIDARYVSGDQSGVGFYTQNLLRGLAAIDPVTCYTYLIQRGREDLGLGRENFVPWQTRVSFENHILGDLWLHAYIPLYLYRHRAHLYHGPAVFLPLLKWGYRSVVTINDLVSFLYPETVPTKYSLYMRLMTRLAVRSANRIIAISESTRDDLVRVLGVPSGKVTMVHLAVSGEFTPTADQRVLPALLGRYHVKPPYILFVGNLEPRKNLVRLIEAFATLKREKRIPHQLVIVGKRGWLFQDIFRAVDRWDLSPHVVFTGYVPAGDLPALYAMADCFAFPSLYEGFGLPVLEAMACGTPVVTARTSSLREIAEGAALLVDPLRVEEIARALEALVCDTSLRARLREKGLERARQFTWDQVAKKTLMVYQEVAQGERIGADRV